jgi:hypothetical protein
MMVNVPKTSMNKKESCQLIIKIESTLKVSMPWNKLMISRRLNKELVLLRAIRDLSKID